MLTRLPKRIAQLRALDRQERHVLFTAIALLPLFSLGLRAFGLVRFQSLLTRRPLPAQVPTAVDASLLAAQVNRAARHSPLAVSCLARSLLLGWMLRRRGIPGELRIGVRLAAGTIEAHAWIECGGVPINDRAAITEEFAAFDRPLLVTSFRRP